MSPLALSCHGLVKDFGPVRAVDHFDLAVERGQVLALVGPSGCGKTTLLRLIAGLERPDEGEVEVEGRRLSGPGVHVPPEKRRVGMVFQDYALFPHLNVAANVAYGVPRGPHQARRVRQVLDLVGLVGLESRMPHTLSGGEQQRLALARALAPEPALLLLDEPFSNLDPGLRARVQAEVRHLLRASGATAVFVTHDQEEALAMGDVVAVMDRGRLEQVDTPQQVFHAPASRFVARFLGEADFLPARVEEGRVWTEIGPAPIQELPESEDGGLEVMVRPDDVALSAAPQGSGTVLERSFRGAFYLYRVGLPSGATVGCLMLHIVDCPPGTRVEVRFASGHPLLCFRDGRALAG